MIINLNYKKSIDLIAILIALIGIPSFFYADYLEILRDRRNQALEYSSEFQLKGIVDNRLHLVGIWESPKMLVLLNSSPSNANLAKAISDAVANKNSLKIDILKVANFFDSVEDCIAVKACDQNTAVELLAHHALDFCEIYGPYLRRMRASRLISDIGDGMGKLATRSKNTSHCVFSEKSK